MKVMMIRPCLEPGGATNSILWLAEGLKQQGHDVLLASSFQEGCHPTLANQYCTIQLPLMPSTYPNMMKSIIKLSQIVQQEQVDLLHSHHRFSNLVCKIVARLKRVTAVATVHEFTNNHSLSTRLGLPRQLITFSAALKSDLLNRYQLPPERIHVVEMGLPRTTPTLAEVSEAAKLFQPINGTTFACLARFSPEKGVSILLQAIHLLKQKAIRPFQCLLLGDGPQYENLVALSQRLNISDCVQFLGWQANISGLIAQIDFLVQPSLNEGFGLTVLEGWAQRKPTVASCVGGLAENITNNKDGLLVPPNDPDQLANAIMTLLNKPQLVQQLGHAGQKKIEQRYSIQTMINQTYQLYQEAFHDN